MTLGVGSVPMKTGRGGNDRLHWAAKAKMVARERAIIDYEALAAMSPRAWPKARLRAQLVDQRFVVLLVRVSPSWKPIDDDNLRGALKATRDSIAKRLFVDDGDRRSVRFEYSQRRGPWAVEFKISAEPRDPLLETQGATR